MGTFVRLFFLSFGVSDASVSSSMGSGFTWLGCCTHPKRCMQHASFSSHSGFGMLREHKETRRGVESAGVGRLGKGRESGARGVLAAC